jgi:hypothetical protein
MKRRSFIDWRAGRDMSGWKEEVAGHEGEDQLRASAGTG